MLEQHFHDELSHSTDYLQASGWRSGFLVLAHRRLKSAEQADIELSGAFCYFYLLLFIALHIQQNSGTACVGIIGDPV